MYVDVCGLYMSILWFSYLCWCYYFQKHASSVRQGAAGCSHRRSLERSRSLIRQGSFGRVACTSYHHCRHETVWKEQHYICNHMHNICPHMPFDFWHFDHFPSFPAQMLAWGDTWTSSASWASWPFTCRQPQTSSDWFLTVLDGFQSFWTPLFYNVLQNVLHNLCIDISRQWRAHAACVLWGSHFVNDRNARTITYMLNYWRHWRTLKRLEKILKDWQKFNK